jgi:hypothetical protein
MGRNEINLKAHVATNSTGPFERRELRVRLLCHVCIKQVVERDIEHIFARLQVVTNTGCASGMYPKQFIGLFKRRVISKNRFQPSDPVRAVAGLAVWNAFEIRAKCLAHGRKYFVCIG